MLLRNLQLNITIISIIFLAVFSSCSRKIITRGNYYYDTHSHQPRAHKHVPPRKCYTWKKYDSKRYLQKKVYGIKYSIEINRREKNVFK